MEGSTNSGCAVSHLSEHKHYTNMLMFIVTGQVHCRLISDTEPVDEDAIVSGFLSKLSYREYQIDEFESNLRLLSLGLNYARSSSGFVLYFHFRSLKELKALRAEYDNGSLKQKAEEDISEFKTLPTDKVKLIMDWPDHDYQRCALYIIRVPSTTVSQSYNV